MKNSLLIALLMLSAFSGAKEQTYQTGKVIEISTLDIDTGLLVGSVHSCCKLRIQAGDSVLSIAIGLKKQCEWSAGSSIQYRLENRIAFLRCPNGKRLEGKVINQVSGHATELVTELKGSGTGPAAAFSPLRTRPRSNLAVPIELDILVGTAHCIRLSANLESDDFFKDFRSISTENGKEFRNFSGEVNVFPERITVIVVISTIPCLEERDTHGSGAQPEFTFDRSFLESLGFEGFWKERVGFEMKNAYLHVLTQAQTCPSSTSDGPGCSWEYELNIWSKGVPLTDVLVIGILSPERKPVTRFSTRLR